MNDGGATQSAAKVLAAPGGSNPGASVENCRLAALRLDETCRQAAVGKRAAQQIGRWAQGVYLAESEFRLLWLLTRGAGDAAVDEISHQRSLAAELAVSQAQLSACAAQLANRGLVACTRSSDDRRRQHCEATEAGRRLVEKVIRELAPAEAVRRLKGEAA